MIVLFTIYNLLLLAGTAWLVGWKAWSPWWFVLTVGLIAQVRYTNETKRNIGD